MDYERYDNFIRNHTRQDILPKAIFIELLLIPIFLLAVVRLKPHLAEKLDSELLEMPKSKKNNLEELPSEV